MPMPQMTGTEEVFRHKSFDDATKRAVCDASV
jgi:hypothetical protein